MSQIQDRCYFPLTENFLELYTLSASFATNGLVHNPEFEVSSVAPCRALGHFSCGIIRMLAFAYPC